ncbi:MAG TPA: porin family protein [Flavobacterium sp.]|nr:porin family protein [Flavobacterium sp.]
MKKVMIAAIAVVGFSVTGLAQQQVKFGPKAGVNLATLSGDDDAEMKIGFHVGAVAEIKFNDKFSLQPEVLYSAQGAQSKENTDIKTNNDYINIPIMAKYYFVEGFSLELGPQVGFLMKAEAKGENGSLDTKDFYKSVDFGVGVGLAYDLPQGFFVNARYNLGLSKINEDFDAGPITIETEDIKNNVIQIGIGYKFD